jgi:hypothetical protein
VRQRWGGVGGAARSFSDTWLIERPGYYIEKFLLLDNRRGLHGDLCNLFF